jgi:hypothetical protein
MRMIRWMAGLALALMVPAGSALLAQSSIYSPTLQGAPIPVRAYGVELAASLAGFPETRPETVDQLMSYGVDVAVRYRLSPHLRVGIRAYMDLSGVAYAGGQRGGLGAELAWTIGDSAARPGMAIIGRVQTVYNGTTSEGVGLGLTFVVQPAEVAGIVPYIGIGPFIGFGDLDGPAPEYQFFILPEELTRPQWGYGGLASLGASIHVSPSVDLVLELAGGAQFNEWESIGSLFIAPSAGLVWRL